MRLPLVCFAALLISIAPAGAQQPAAGDPAPIIAGLGQTKREHPYLVFSSADKPAILARIKSDRRAGETFERLLLEGRRLMYATVEREVPKRVVHTRYLNTNEYERYIREQLDAAYTLAFLYQMTGDPAYAAKAFEHADRVCAEESWVEGAHHFEVIYSRVWPYGAKDDEVVFSYDIRTAGICQGLAYVYDWLYPAITKAQRDRIRGALLEKGITRVRGSYDYFWWSSAAKCNWSGICYSGLGLASLALLDEDPQLVDVIARSQAGVSAMLDHMGNDGAWQEGRGYWAYGMAESVRFIDALKRVSDDRVNLFRHPALSSHPLDFALYGLTGGFGDGTGTPVGDPAVLNKLVAEAHDGRGAWYIQNFVRLGEDVQDLLWPRPAVAPEKPAEGSKHFTTIDWAFLRKDFTANSVTLATKAGMNDDPHHGHLDIGSFNLTWQNLPFIAEAPRTPYDEQYFGALRWTYLEARSFGHNVVTVNGEEQIVAKLKDQPWREGVGGKITQYDGEGPLVSLTIDASKAYPGKEVKGWQRTLVLDEDNNITIAFDRVRCAVGATIDVRFHPGVEFELRQNRATLRAALPPGTGPTRTQGGNVVTARERTTRGAVQLGTATERRDLEMVALVAGQADYALVQGRQPDLPVMQDATVTWAPYLATVLKAPAEENLIATVFAPAGVATDLTLVMEQGTPVVKGKIAGKPCAFVFRPDGVTRKD
jgi:hypothetical protein